MKSRECKKCGASLDEKSKQCSYCGTWYEGNHSVRSPRDWPRRIMSIFNPPQGVGEFGISNKRFFTVGVLITIGLYILGWLFEDTNYWLDDTAVLIWMGLTPLLLFGIALLWQTDHKVVIIGLAISVLVFIVHLIIIWAIRGSLWDDHVGIAALVAISMLGGWLLGRLAHGAIRWRNSRAQ